MLEVTPEIIRSRFPDLISSTKGDEKTVLKKVSSPDQIEKQGLVFLVDNKFQEKTLASAAGAIVTSTKNQAAIESLSAEILGNKTFLFTSNVRLAMALIINEFFAEETPLVQSNKIHPTAIIALSAKLGANVTVGPYSVVGENVHIGDGVRLDASVIIEADAKIKKDCHLFSNLYIGPRTEIGERCVIFPNSTIGSEGYGFAPDENGRMHRIPQMGKVVIENDVEIGANCTIDRATFDVTRIGEGTKIDKLCHIAHNCIIGKHCVITASFAVAGSTTIGNHFIAGGRCTVRGGINICDRVELAAASGVHNNITEPGQYGGHPLQPVRDSMRTITSLSSVPKMRKQIALLFKHLGLIDEDSE